MVLVDSLLRDNDDITVEVEQKKNEIELGIRKKFKRVTLRFTDDSVRITKMVQEELPLAQPDCLDQLTATLAAFDISLESPARSLISLKSPVSKPEQSRSSRWSYLFNSRF